MESCIYCKTRLGKSLYRGLCDACYRDPVVRATVPLRRCLKPDDPVCKWCAIRKGLSANRGLCSRCHDIPEIRAQFPSGLTRQLEQPAKLFLPTSHLPGTEGKLRAMQARRRAGFPLFHPQDPVREDTLRDEGEPHSDAGSTE